MKRLIFICTFLLLAACVSAQNTFKYEVRVPSLRIGTATNVKIDSVSVSGDTIRFFSGPTELLPKGYLSGTSASMIYPGGSGIPLVVSGTSWGTTITNNSTNWNTAYGWGNHAGLYSPLSHNQSQSTITALADSLLVRYTKAQVDLIIAGIRAGFDTTRIYAILDSLITAMGDTINVADALHFDPATDTLEIKANVRLKLAKADSLTKYVTPTQLKDSLDAIGAGLNIETVMDSILLRSEAVFVFGAGSGAAGDSILFAKGAKAFGAFNTYRDSLYVSDFNVLYITAGDSLNFNCYWGNRMTGVATDSLFNAVTAVGEDQNILTPNDRKIPPNNDVWLELKADQLTGLRPKQFEIQLNGYRIKAY